LWNHFIQCQVNSMTPIVYAKSFYTTSMCQNRFRIHSHHHMHLTKGWFMELIPLGIYHGIEYNADQVNHGGRTQNHPLITYEHKMAHHLVSPIQSEIS
jgi:hypothetical protein